MKKWMSLSIISLLLIIVALGIILPSGLAFRIQGKLIEEKYPDEQPASYKVIYENTLTEELSNYFTLTYNCEDYNNQIRCSGNARYIGPENYNTPELYVRLYCFNENLFDNGKKEECTLDNDYLYIGNMNTQKNTQDYQLKCFYGDERTFSVKIGLSSGVVVYPYRC